MTGVGTAEHRLSVRGVGISVGMVESHALAT